MTNMLIYFDQNAIARHVILRQVKAMGLVSADYVSEFDACACLT